MWSRWTLPPGKLNTAVWTTFTADDELGYVYLPVEAPTHDLYGGHRLGNNLY